MLVVYIVLSSLFLISSIFLNLVLFKKAELQLNRAEIYELWIQEFQKDVENVYKNIKSIDDRNMFEKDDDVGIIFKEMVNIIKKLNSRIQNIDEE